MSDDTRQQTREMAEALQVIRAQPDLPPELARKLQDAIDTALRLGNDGLADQVQATVGLTHISLRQHITQNTDMVAGMREDMDAWRKDHEQSSDQLARELIALRQSLAQREAVDAGYIGAIQEMTTAANTLRSEFQRGMAALGETVSQIEIVQGEHSERIGRLEARADAAEDRQGTTDARIATLQAQVDALLKHAGILGHELGYDA